MYKYITGFRQINIQTLICEDCYSQIYRFSLRSMHFDLNKTKKQKKKNTILVIKSIGY